MADRLAELIQIVKDSNNLVFFGGAGVSTESQIPDFRGATGLYSQTGERYPAEEILSHHFFLANPADFYDFYFHKMVYLDAKPNACHLALVELEKMGKLKAIVTQNIDGLHQKAGSKNVIELHGSIMRNHCMDCGASYELEYLLKFKGGTPKCARCGGLIKPDVVLYEEPLDYQVIDKAVAAISQADTLIVAGTSLVVYPAASFIRYFRGAHLILINENPTPMDANFEFIVKAKVGEVFTKIMQELKK